MSASASFLDLQSKAHQHGKPPSQKGTNSAHKGPQYCISAVHSIIICWWQSTSNKIKTFTVSDPPMREELVYVLSSSEMHRWLWWICILTFKSHGLSTLPCMNQKVGTLTQPWRMARVARGTGYAQKSPGKFYSIEGLVTRGRTVFLYSAVTKVLGTPRTSSKTAWASIATICLML